MAKELPYFQFEPAEYLTKDVSFCSLSAQGLFINLCAYYWQRECNLTKNQFLRRLNNPDELNELIKEGVIDLDNDTIIIKFLDAQYENATKLSKTNSINGSKGGRPKKINPIKTENKPTALNSLSETKGIREDNRIEDKITTKIVDDGSADSFLKSLEPASKKEIEQMYNSFVTDIKAEKFKDQIESLYKLLKIKEGSLTNLLKDFKENVIVRKTRHKNTNDFFINFTNWLNVQDRNKLLDKYKK
jgi:hypothetical protein